MQDCPGVLAQIGTILGNQDISISSVIQKEPHCENSVSLIILTHKAYEANMCQARIEIDNLEVVQEKLTLMSRSPSGKSSNSRSTTLTNETFTDLLGLNVFKFICLLVHCHFSRRNNYPGNT